jgi:hypothetical protein
LYNIFRTFYPGIDFVGLFDFDGYLLDFDDHLGFSDLREADFHVDHAFVTLLFIFKY